MLVAKSETIVDGRLCSLSEWFSAVLGAGFDEWFRRTEALAGFNLNESPTWARILRGNCMQQHPGPDPRPSAFFNWVIPWQTVRRFEAPRYTVQASNSHIPH